MLRPYFRILILIRSARPRSGSLFSQGLAPSDPDNHSALFAFFPIHLVKFSYIVDVYFLNFYTHDSLKPLVCSHSESLTNESIQYLLRHKKFDKIERVLTHIAASNKTDFDQASWKSFLSKVSKLFSFDYCSCRSV